MSTTIKQDGYTYEPTGEFRVPKEGEWFVTDVSTVDDIVTGKARVSYGARGTPRIILKRNDISVTVLSNYGAEVTVEAHHDFLQSVNPDSMYLVVKGGGRDAILSREAIQTLHAAMGTWLADTHIHTRRERKSFSVGSSS